MPALPYRLGRALGSQRGLIAIGLALSLSTCVFLEKASVKAAQERAAKTAQEKERAKAASEAAEAKRLADLAASCTSTGERYRDASTHAKAGRLVDALIALQPCQNHLTDPTVLALYKRGEAASLAADAQDRRRKEAEAKKQLALEKAAKKKEGVRIGMSQQDVLDSSWGRPERINETTSPRGSREQWVYGGGNYLYFQDGVLTSVQTRR